MLLTKNIWTSELINETNYMCINSLLSKFIFYLSLVICMCCMCAYMFIYVLYTCVHTQRSHRLMLRVFLYSCPLGFWGRVSRWTQSSQFNKTRRPASFGDSPPPATLYWGYRCMPPCLAFPSSFHMYVHVLWLFVCMHACWRVCGCRSVMVATVCTWR